MAKAATTTPRSDELDALILIAADDEEPGCIAARDKIRERFPTVGRFMRFRGEYSRRAARATAEDATAFFRAMNDARFDNEDTQQLGRYALLAVAQDGPRVLAVRAQAFLTAWYARAGESPDEIAHLWSA